VIAWRISMRVVKSPFQEVDLGDTTYILGTELYQPGLASAGVDPKRIIRLYIWGFEEVE
jgi:hypothetical protein